MKSSQSVVVERLQQAQNEHYLEALLACFAPDFQGDHPLHLKWSRWYMEPVQASSRGWSKSLLSTIIAAVLIGGFLPSEAIAFRNLPTPRLSQASPVLMATAYTDSTLPTLRRGDRGSSVQQLQQILLDNGSLGAASVRLGNPSGGTALDGIFGPVTESAVRDLQQRYSVPVTGEMNPRTWEVLDMEENPYRSPLPWKL